jgi:hypothetical protein
MGWWQEWDRDDIEIIARIRVVLIKAPSANGQGYSMRRKYIGLDFEVEQPHDLSSDIRSFGEVKRV